MSVEDIELENLNISMNSNLDENQYILEQLEQIKKIKAENPTNFKRLTDEDIFKSEIPFGKYKAYRIHHVYAVDPQYICFFLCKSKYFKHAKQLQRYLIDNDKMVF
jgi:hypothetical protein